MRHLTLASFMTAAILLSGCAASNLMNRRDYTVPLTVNGDHNTINFYTCLKYENYFDAKQDTDANLGYNKPGADGLDFLDKELVP